MTFEYARRTVVYHSHEWACLVEQGWVTDSVDDVTETISIAYMIRRR